MRIVPAKLVEFKWVVLWELIGAMCWPTVCGGGGRSQNVKPSAVTWYPLSFPGILALIGHQVWYSQPNNHHISSGRDFLHLRKRYSKEPLKESFWDLFLFLPFPRIFASSDMRMGEEEVAHGHRGQDDKDAEDGNDDSLPVSLCRASSNQVLNTRLCWIESQPKTFVVVIIVVVVVSVVGIV